MNLQLPPLPTRLKVSSRQFVLCLLVNKVVLKNTEKPFEIKIETSDKMHITDAKTTEKFIHVITSENKIYVFDVKKGAYKGSISFAGEQ